MHISTGQAEINPNPVQQSPAAHSTLITLRKLDICITIHPSPLTDPVSPSPTQVSQR